MNAPQASRIMPPDTEISRPYWDGCKQGVLRLQYCSDCDRFQFYPRILCSECGGRSLSWRSVSGRGRVASFTVVRRGISPAYPAPYVVALIDLEEGPRMMSNIIVDDSQPVAVGDTVIVGFQPWGADHVMPVFELDKVSR
ncbi:Zn-ribbon domain-containing OB-fold protein [Seongchinamella unica]|nr:OB-fold domain-containing protein [Seongchinamella unica]